jgi:PAS domain S-box-containing protein
MASAPKLEVGHGLGKGSDSFTVGVEAARQARRGIREHTPCLVMVFASARYDLEELLRGVQAVMQDAPVVGGTTAGEICNGPHQESVVVVALASPYLKVRVGVGTGVARNWRQAVNQAVCTPAIAPFFSPQSAIWSELTLTGKSAFALLFSPGNTRSANSRSFEVLEELKRLSEGRLPIMGGAAADDWRMETNYVLYGRRAYPDSILVAVIETHLRFGIALAHGFSPTLQKATVTRATNHEVLELDHQPAAEVYSRLQGRSRKDLEAKHLTLTTRKPVGILDPYKQYSINVASYFTDAGGVRFSQPVPEGTILTIMEAGEDNLVKAGQEALRKAMLRGSITNPALILTFSCALRARILGERTGEEIASIKHIMLQVPVAGYYSFGEQGLADDEVNRHNNGVITILVLSQELSYAAQVALENERLRSKVKQTEALKAAYAALKKQVAERRKAQEALQESEKNYRRIVETAYEGIWCIDLEDKIVFVNARMAEMLGYAANELMGQPIAMVLEPEWLALALAKIEEHLRKGLKEQVDLKFRRKDGTDLWGIVTASPLLTQKGRYSGALGMVTDITRRKRAEEALRQSEEQLRQAQKLEAIGRLAGGIAHDFNNILTAIGGYCELLLQTLERPDPRHRDVQGIQEATDRAATLTRQLLAFSRKQVTQPRPLNLNEVAADTDKMLRRLIREDIDLKTILDPQLGAVTADLGQIEQVIMNLVVNARDAMPAGGRLTLETANVELDEIYIQGHTPVKAGPYVLLAVSDTGVGLDQQAREHLFEPFFTTKKQGQGTGLGLSTVYGIVKQGGGFITVYSEEGKGTTFKIYLPRLTRDLTAATPAPPSISEATGSETILLAEDEEIVRSVIHRILAGSGYAVLEAGSGPEAIKISGEHQAPIHLLLTDVLMPEMNGPKLAESIMPFRPNIKVLYMSGHTENAIVHHGVLDPEIAFIQKPFRRDSLLRKVRQVLDSGAGADERQVEARRRAG